jgi:hypothetical protein
MRGLLFLSFALLPVAVIGCARDVRLCSSQDSCSLPTMCVSGRCLAAPDAAAPVVESSERVVLRPVVSKPETDEARLSSGTRWVLGYQMPNTGKQVVEAYVLLRPVARPLQSPMDLYADDGGHTYWRALFPTHAGARVHVDPPSLSDPASASVVRIDVKEAINRRTGQKGQESPILLTLNGSGEGAGITFASTGSDEPVLEIYLRTASANE